MYYLNLHNSFTFLGKMKIMKKNILFIFVLLLCFCNSITAQDECSTAVDITASLTGVCNNIPSPFAFAATPGSLEDACGAASGPTDAIWFTFTAPFTGFIDVTSTENPSTPDTQVSILEGGCGSQVCLLLDDDGGNGFTSAAMGVPVVAGNQYWIEWTDGYGGAPEFFDVRIVETFPPVTTDVQDVTAEIDLAGACAGAVVEYGTPGFAEGTGTDGSSGSLSGLIPETEYEVCISCGNPALCGFTGITSGDESTSRVCTTFTTFAACDPLAVEAVADVTSCPGDPVELSATLNDVIPGAFVDYTVTSAASCPVPIPDGTPIDYTLGDDQGTGPIPLGFNFDFFGTTYTDVCISSNGYVTLACSDETDFSDDAIPSAIDPNAIIALFWDDLNGSNGNGLIQSYSSTIGGQTCFVANYDIGHLGAGEAVTGQIILCPDGTITINCVDCQSDGGIDPAVQGIENEDGTVGFFDPAFPDGVVPGAATTSNCVTFTPNVDPDSACDFVAWVTDINDIAGTTVGTTNPLTVSPTMTTTYYAIVDCGGLQCTDEVIVTMDDPANCTVFTFSIDDPCNCTDGIDEDMDGINDFALETITLTPGSAPYDVTLTTPGLVDDTGTILTDADIEALIAAADPGTGEPFDIIVYLPADGSTIYGIEITDGNSTTVNFVKPEGCPVCPDIANIPTVGEWGLMILGLLMSITAVVGIRQRREEEVYG